MTEDVTRDAFLGGKLTLLQPRDGYRAGIDPVLLAACVPAKPGESLLDLGCGVGTAALCAQARVPGINALGVERQPLYADLARRNGLDCITADLAQLPDEVRDRQFDHVIANPPFFSPQAHTRARDEGRAEGRGEADTPLTQWFDIAARRLAPKGYLHVIQRAERLPEMLTACADRLGSIEVLPIAPRPEKPAKLVILRARKSGRAAFRLHAPVILHEGDHHVADGESYRPEINAVLRTCATLWR